MDSRAVNVKVVFTRDIEGFDAAVAADSSGMGRFVIVVRDAFPMMLRSELFRMVA